MRPISLIALLSTVLSATSCDVFLPDVGHEGEPCSLDNEECYGDLVCIHGDCAQRSELGGPCDWDQLFTVQKCIDGLWCGVDETCIEAGALSEPCRIDPYGVICDDYYDIHPCDGALICSATMIENYGNYHDDVIVGECVDLNAAAGAGDDCLCEFEYGPLCLSVCDGSWEYDEGICGDDLSCNGDGICE
jgi:hypothetical protein